MLARQLALEECPASSPQLSRRWAIVRWSTRSDPAKLHHSAKLHYRASVPHFPPLEPSRRDLKKEQTRQQLTHAALHILREHGREGLTAEAIADGAGVSRRTFFNYFPSVESVVRDAIGAFFTWIADLLTHRPASEPLLDSLQYVLATPPDPALLEHLTILGAVGQQHQETRSLLKEYSDEWLIWLEQFIAHRTHHQHDSVYVLGLAAATVAAAEATFLLWYRVTNGTVNTESTQIFQSLWKQSFQYIKDGYRLA